MQKLHEDPPILVDQLEWEDIACSIISQITPLPSNALSFTGP